MPKKIVIACSLLALVTTLGFVTFGCGSATDTTTTTTTPTTTTIATISSAQVDTAKSGVLMAGGGASIGVAATSIGTSSNNSPKVSSVASAVRGFLGNPPATFFTVDLTTGTASVDGYFSPITTSVLGGNMSPYIRLNTVGGVVVKGTYLSGKKIANLSPCSVEAIFAGSPTEKPVGIDTGITNFITNWMTITAGGTNPSTGYSSNTLFTGLKYMSDYLCWAYIYPTMESGMANISGWPASAHITTPEAGTTDKIKSMDCKMVFANVVTGEIVVNIACETDGRPSVGTYSGTGKLTTPVATMDVTASLVFPTAGSPPSSVTLVGTNETAPLYTVIVEITNPAAGTGTGKILDSNGTQIATLEASASGGKVTGSGTSETFTF